MKASESLSGDGNLLTQIGRIYLRKKELIKAEHYFSLAKETSIEVNKINPYLAELAFQRNDHNTARQLLHHCRDLLHMPKVAPIIRQWVDAK